MLKNEYDDCIKFSEISITKDKKEYLKLAENILSTVKIVEDYFSQSEMCEINQAQLEENDSVYFARKNNSTSYILSDIENIPIENYENVNKIISSFMYNSGIISAEKKKKFTNNLELKNIFEVKMDNLRLFYQPLGNNKYFAIGLFEKKSQKAKVYMNKIKNRAITCQNEYEALRLQFKNNEIDEETVNINKQYVVDIFNKVKPTSKTMK